MSDLLQVLGSTIIGGLIILMLLSLNLQFSDSSREVFQSAINQRSSITSAQVVEYDLYKIGYRTPNNKITLADSNQIKYKTDIDNNGVVDSVYYYQGSLLTATTNPNDKPLYRKKNTGTAELVTILTNFKLTYYDSLGRIISYASLSSQTNRNKIKELKTNLTFELPDMVNNTYYPMNWSRKIRPKNLN